LFTEKDTGISRNHKQRSLCKTGSTPYSPHPSPEENVEETGRYNGRGKEGRKEKEGSGKDWGGEENGN